MVAPFRFEGGITVEGGISIGPDVVLSPSFLLSDTDFTNGYEFYQDTTPIGTNGNEGFENTAAQSNLYQGYVGTVLTTDAVARISAAIVAAGLDPQNTTGYIWTVTWGAGSSVRNGIVKFAFYDGNGDPGNSYFYMQAVDPADPNWQLPGASNGTSLVGTFLFPGDFTVHIPLINKGDWC